MKNTLILIFTVTTIALGAVCVGQWRQLNGQKAEMVALRSESAQASRQVQELEALQRLADHQRGELQLQADDLTRKLGESQRAAATVDPSVPVGAAVVAAPESQANPKGGFGNFLAKVMEDPEARKLIREQQRATLDQLYNPLVKQMALLPEEASQFKDLLADNMLKGAEKATSLLGGDAATNRTEAINTLAEEQKSFEERVRGFLGESRYAQYQDYQQTVGERAQLNQFRLQTGSADNALNEPQTEQLLAIMKEEKQAVAAASGQPFPGEAKDAANLQAMFFGAGADKILQSQEAVNQRVYARAKGVLSPGQMDSFGKFQTNQLQMMRVGMSMAQKFLSPAKSDGSSPQPNQ